MKNILITSGNTIEPIDNVRKIVNSSSGQLGAMIADTILSEELGRVYYICSNKSIIPETKNIDLEVIYADSVQETYSAMCDLLTNSSFNITHVVHARAISDYEVDWVSSSDRIKSYIEQYDAIHRMEDFFEFVQKSNIYKIDRNEKISSSEDDLIIRLRKAPKIIKSIKTWNPNVVLIGFKLLSNVTVGDLMSAAGKQMLECHCNYVVANDITEISKDKHHAYLLGKKDIKEMFTKQDIANNIVDIIEKT